MNAAIEHLGLILPSVHSGPGHHRWRVLRRGRVARARDAHQGASVAARGGRPDAAAAATAAARRRGYRGPRERSVDHRVWPGLQAHRRARRVPVHGPRQVRRAGAAVRAPIGRVAAGRQGG